MKIFWLNTWFNKLSSIIIMLLMGYSCFLITKNKEDYHFILMGLVYIIEIFLIFATYYINTNAIIIYKESLLIFDFKIKKFKINEISKIEAKNEHIYITHKKKKYKISGFCFKRYAYYKNCERTKQIVDRINNLIQKS